MAAYTSEENEIEMRKDNAVSTLFREKADALINYVTDLNIYEIISKYNKAVACAEKGSVTLALAFAGRSRICSVVTEYKSCLFNIKMAKLNNYPEHKLKKLLEFEERMKLKLENKKPKPREETDFFTLSHPENFDFPFMIDAIRFKNDIHGHHLITTIPLKCGDVVAIEKTFTNSSLLEASAKKCANCNKFSLFDLLPCEGCCSAMFCSMRCYKFAKAGYHSFECAVIDQIKTTYDESHAEFLLLKPLFKALAMFDGSVKYLQHFLNKNKKVITIFDLILTRPSWPSDKELLIMSMARSCWCPLTSKESRRREHAYDFFMRLFPRMNVLMKIPRYRDFLHGFIITQSYGLVAQSSSRKLKGSSGDLFGGVSVLKRFMFHSCVPNIHSFVYDNGDLAHIVQYPIPAGGQLTASHSHEFQHQSLNIRRSDHFRTFGIWCKCIACTIAPRFPLEIDLLIMNRHMYSIVLDQTLTAQDMTTNILVAKFKANCKFFNENVQNFPTRELIMIQYCNMKIINQLLGRVFMKS